MQMPSRREAVLVLHWQGNRGLSTPEDEAEEIIGAIRFKRLTPHTITSRSALLTD